MSQAIIKINEFHGPCRTKVYVHTHTHIDTQTHTKLPMISATLPTSPEVIHTQNAKDRGRVCWSGEGVPLMYFKQRITRWSHVNLHILLWSITTGKSGGREYSIKILVQASIVRRSCSGKRWQGLNLGTRGKAREEVRKAAGLSEWVNVSHEEESEQTSYFQLEKLGNTNGIKG